MPASRGDINGLTKKIEMNATDLLAGIKELRDQTEKSKGEIVSAVEALNATVAVLEGKIRDLNNGQLPDGVAEAFEDLKTSIQSIYNLNADATPPAP